MHYVRPFCRDLCCYVKPSTSPCETNCENEVLKFRNRLAMMGKTPKYIQMSTMEVFYGTAVKTAVIAIRTPDDQKMHLESVMKRAYTFARNFRNQEIGFIRYLTPGLFPLP